MSHELRTPLNTILGFGQILERQDLAPSSKEGVGYILKGGKHLLRLINEVLDIARVEAGHMELLLEPIALYEVVSEVCTLVRPMAAERSIRLDEGTSEKDHGYILADRQRLQQVLINLLANAIKYNREGGEVKIACGQTPDGRITIAVSDTGPGISPENLTRLFVPFERLNAASSGIEGTGLGLPLSQRMVVAMDGTLKVRSTLAQGTTFTIDLPKSISPMKPVLELPVDLPQLGVSQNVKVTYSILCIEDNLSNLRLIESIFEMRPEWTLLTTMQGRIGLDLARQQQPGLILLDLNLPDIHGLEVLTRLQQSTITREIPVVIVSADATPKQIERLLEAGARAYLTKPLNVEQFLHTIDQLLHLPILEALPASDSSIKANKS